MNSGARGVIAARASRGRKLAGRALIGGYGGVSPATRHGDAISGRVDRQKLGEERESAREKEGEGGGGVEGPAG